MRRPTFILATILSVTVSFLLARPVQAQQGMGSKLVSPEVAKDGRVTFRLLAAGAKDVKVAGDFTAKPLQMVKDQNGVWSYTTTPLKPEIYGYYFQLEGRRVPDPANLFASNSNQYLKTYFEVPGDTPGYWAMRADVPHGTVHEHYYNNADLKATRRFLLYTPPGYASSPDKSYPVLYLYHGAGDDETMWTRVGRANFVMDNLIAEGKAVPALIAMPFGHAVRNFREGSNGGQGPTPTIEKDLFDNVMPIVEKEYRVKKDADHRAIAGLSMGGGQALAIGLKQPDKFASVAAFSAPIGQAGQYRALADPAQANKNVKLLWIGVGSDDPMVGGSIRFHESLENKMIRHHWELTQGGLHNWLVWRPYLRDVLAKLFKE
jgi:enterochelin esterase-like enzyme